MKVLWEVTKITDCSMLSSAFFISFFNPVIARKWNRNGIPLVSCIVVLFWISCENQNGCLIL